MAFGLSRKGLTRYGWAPPSRSPTAARQQGTEGRLSTPHDQGREGPPIVLTRGWFHIEQLIGCRLLPRPGSLPRFSAKRPLSRHLGAAFWVSSRHPTQKENSEVDFQFGPSTSNLSLPPPTHSFLLPFRSISRPSAAHLLAVTCCNSLSHRILS